MRFHLILATAALAVGTVAQTSNDFGYYHGDRTSFTSRSGLAGGNEGDILKLYGAAFGAGGEYIDSNNQTACAVRQTVWVFQDQNAATQQDYYCVIHAKANANPKAGFQYEPDNTTGGLISRSVNFTSPSGGNSPAAWQVTVTWATNAQNPNGPQVPCDTPFYTGLHLPAEPTWTADGLSIHGAWFTAGTNGDCPKAGFPSLIAVLNGDRTTNPPIADADDHEHRIWHRTLAGGLENGQDVDSTVVTRCADPNFGSGGAGPDTAGSARRDGILFRFKAAGETAGTVFLSAVPATPPLTFPFINGRIHLDPLTLTFVGTTTIQANGLGTLAPAFMAQGQIPVGINGALNFQGITQGTAGLSGTNWTRTWFGAANP